MKILLIEDDQTLVDILVSTLTAEHYAVDVAADGESGWEMASGFVYDLILLDVMLPKLDGISLCRKLRSHGSQTAILLLTAKDTSTSKVMGLDAGADDYMTKPFDPAELLARIRALQRRESTTRQPVLTWEGLAMDPSTREVVYRDEPIYLRPREYDLLELFLRNPQRVFSRGSILDHLWSFEESPGEETVTAHIKGLRHHLKTAGIPHDPIETVYGIGYRLRAAEPAATATAANTVTAAIWERAKARLRERIAIIEQATSAASADTLADELRQQAETEAHKLAGSLGMFNFDQGSQLAQQAEQAFHDWPRLPPGQRTQMIQLAETLSQSVQQAIRSDTPQLFDPEGEPSAEHSPVPLSPAIQAAPYLWVVSQDPAFCETLLAADSTTHWTIQVQTDAIAACAVLTQRRPHLVLIDLPAADPLSTELVTFLAELQTITPRVPVLVRADPGTLLDRAELARLGSRGWVSPGQSAAEVLATATDLWVRSRPSASTILVVDDDPQVLEAVQCLLEPWGLTVFTLDDPRRFWTVFNDAQPDLLVLDVEMPYIDGLALCQVVRSDLQQSHLPILFLTAHTDAATQHRVFEVGADDYVAKPIIGPTLITRILNRLERSRLRQSRRKL
ncbi:MAG: response regulator [Cyanobacteria bacterium J06626_23]